MSYDQIDNGYCLAMHLVSEHADPLAITRDLAGNTEQHDHEHDGPGTIRNHLRASRLYQQDKIEEVLEELEAEEGELPAPDSSSREWWRLEGYDTFSAESYPLDNDGYKPFYYAWDEVMGAARRRLEELERSQPSASSGGQSGIQDRVYIISSTGRRKRIQ